jgi:hypothetical protein
VEQERVQMTSIIFTNTMGVPEEFVPKPATSFVPEWYKNVGSYLNNEKKPTGNGKSPGTIKRCMPVFDAITHGYIITTYVDIWVSQKQQPTAEGELKVLPWYEWPSFDPIEFHPFAQAPNHPKSNGGPYPKLINPWGIKTPPGYSTMFLAPVHRDNVFTIFPGVVDTDTYTAPVNFPMVLSDINFRGLIPAGTPIAQVIPFKRESWTMELGKDEDLVQQNLVLKKLRTRFFDSYKDQYRQVKEYK